MNDINVMDLEDLEGDRFERSVRECWIMVFLLALRDELDVIGLEMKAAEVRFWLEGPAGAFDIAPLPVEMVPKALAFVWRIGQTPRQGYLDKFRFIRARNRPVPPSVWESRFRIKLGAGFRNVEASATTEDGCSRLTLKMQDITILKDDAADTLKRMTLELQSAIDKASSE